MAENGGEVDDCCDAFHCCRQRVGSEDVALGALDTILKFLAWPDECTAFDARFGQSPEQPGPARLICEEDRAMGEDQVEVLSGVSDQGYRWLVEAGGSEDHFMTMLKMFDDDRLVFGGGMGGPKLYPGTVIHESRHRKDELPYVLVARTAPHVDRVVATTDLGVEIVLPLSEVIGQFELRFAAVVLPNGQAPGSIRAESEGEVVQTARQWMPQLHAPGGPRFGVRSAAPPEIFHRRDDPNDQGRNP